MAWKKLREGIGSGLRTLFPPAHRAISRRWGRGGAAYRISALLRARGFDGKVMEGPFRGMQYGARAAGSKFFPKVIGCYECELHDTVKWILSHGYEKVIDIGCAEGYYAVGIAMRCPAAQVVAFEMDPIARNLCGEMARLNACEGRIKIEGICTPAGLAEELGDRGNQLVICDCEGAELDILDPKSVPALSRSDMLVELHDIFFPGLTGTLTSRFTSTHEIQIIPAKPRAAGSVALIESLKPADQISALTERPAGMSWAWMKARAR